MRAYITQLANAVTTRPKCTNVSCPRYGMTKDVRESGGNTYHECSGCGQ